MTLKAEWDGKTYQYVPFDWEVSIAPIDPVLVYRKIEPGYTTTNTMSINQRNLTNFNDEVLIDNMKSETGCINCHSFVRMIGSDAVSFTSEKSWDLFYPTWRNRK